MSVAVMTDESAKYLKPKRSKRNQPSQTLAQAQETIYGFLLNIVHEWDADDVLQEFRKLFIDFSNTTDEASVPALYSIIFANQEADFRNTIKRCCYILINNWELQRNYHSIQDLLQIFTNADLSKTSVVKPRQRLRTWLKAFVDSQDFEELKLFANRHEELNAASTSWVNRYTSYLLVPQYANFNNPIEQREAARNLSRRLRERFKFDLAIYTSCSDAAIAKGKQAKNPTSLGDGALRMIKTIVARRGQFSYENLAHIFIRQTQNLRYEAFKQSLQEYLIFSVGHPELVQTLQKQLANKLETLYEEHHDKVIDDALLLRTCNRIIEYLTTEDGECPSSLFILLLSKGNPLTLVIVLLKLTLICKYSRTHLESRIAGLIRYYSEFPENDCQWIVNFMEIFNITMTIHAENIEYNLVRMSSSGDSDNNNHTNLDSYRIFSQLRKDAALESTSAAQELDFAQRLEQMVEEQRSQLTAESSNLDQDYMQQRR